MLQLTSKALSNSQFVSLQVAIPTKDAANSLLKVLGLTVASIYILELKTPLDARLLGLDSARPPLRGRLSLWYSLAELVAASVKGGFTSITVTE